jgi:hypothetical protein
MTVEYQWVDRVKRVGEVAATRGTGTAEYEFALLRHAFVRPAHGMVQSRLTGGTSLGGQC